MCLVCVSISVGALAMTMKAQEEDMGVSYFHYPSYLLEKPSVIEIGVRLVANKSSNPSVSALLHP